MGRNDRWRKLGKHGENRSIEIISRTKTEKRKIKRKRFLWEIKRHFQFLEEVPWERPMGEPKRLQANAKAVSKLKVVSRGWRKQSNEKENV
ncbi:hypothetical protein L6452_13280 [Arctium lappa]|uniref:Uncharacterized protein n=1 Tax=Arctium lappa TaxID=4217 RepID=A0ACB9CHN7_ARCLA|nr:hypothetical protein L6452_13280 [Arctium lappa]